MKEYILILGELLLIIINYYEYFFGIKLLILLNLETCNDV